MLERLISLTHPSALRGTDQSGTKATIPSSQTPPDTRTGTGEHTKDTKARVQSKRKDEQKASLVCSCIYSGVRSCGEVVCEWLNSNDSIYKTKPNQRQHQSVLLLTFVIMTQPNEGSNHRRQFKKKVKTICQECVYHRCNG